MIRRAIDFEIHFHGPFRIATGEAQGVADVAVDPDNPVPASSLKGVMRAEAKRLFGDGYLLVDEVFGKESIPSPWAWTDVEFDRVPSVLERSRVAVDDRTGTVVDGAVVRSQEQWIDTPGRFRVIWRTHGVPPAEHVTVLAAAAASVKALGADRRRGFGWVSVRPMGDGFVDLAERTLDLAGGYPSDSPGVVGTAQIGVPA